MRLPFHRALSSAVVVTVLLAAAAQDEIPEQAKGNGKVCVATVGNASTTSAFVEGLTRRLTQNLVQNKVNAISMESRTTTDRQLRMTTENGEESKDKQCDYILLTQIYSPGSRPEEPQDPVISIGSSVPSVDASDRMSPPVYRNSLKISFALFRIARMKPVLEAAILQEPSANVSDSFLPAMDREANRVTHELKKK
jgi:hypothetical protein